jgi:hypothetical protein
LAVKARQLILVDGDELTQAVCHPAAEQSENNIVTTGRQELAELHTCSRWQHSKTIWLLPDVAVAVACLFIS